MRFFTRTLLVAKVSLFAAALAFASNGGSSGGGSGGSGKGGGNGPGGGGVTIPPPPAPPTNPVEAVPGQILIWDSFSFGSNLSRASGGNGALSPVNIRTDLSGFWAEVPNNNTEIWSAPAARHARTWAFAISSADPKEPASALASPDVSNGTIALTSDGSAFDNPAALVPFQPLPIPYEVSVDLVSPPRLVGDWLGVGFSTSNAVNQNLETAGQAWLLLKTDDPQVNPANAIVELHTNGLSGASTRTPVVLTNFDTLTVRVDPIAKTVSAYFNGTNVGIIPYDASAVRFAGFEGATGATDFIGIDNFVVKASD